MQSTCRATDDRFSGIRLTPRCFVCIRYLVIDLAFVIQGNDPEELPEHVLGTARLSRINLSTAAELPPHVPARAQPVAASQPAAP